MTRKPSDSRRSLIEAVKTPLAFLVLGLLVVDGTVATMATALPDWRPVLVWTVVGSIPLFMIIVVGLAAWRPEALRGDRPLQDVHANQFASDLFIALDGALSNLEPVEREEAWLTVADVITSDEKGDRSYEQFCGAVAAKLKKLGNLSGRGVNTRGPIESPP